MGLKDKSAKVNISDNALELLTTESELRRVNGSSGKAVEATGASVASVHGRSMLIKCIRLTNRTCHFAAEFAEVGG